MCALALKRKVAPTPHPLPTPTTPVVQLYLYILKMEGMECSGGPVRAKKEPTCHGATALPPAPPACNIAWVAFRGGPRGRKIGCFFARRSGARVTFAQLNITSGGPGASGGRSISSAVYFARTGISDIHL